MYDQIREDILFIILYSVVTAMAMMASCYLLFRQGNAFAKDLTPPTRLRWWTAAFFAALVLNHLVYMPIFFLSSSEDIHYFLWRSSYCSLCCKTAGARCGLLLR